MGKTDLAIELYKNLDIKIISVDSVQIYKHLNIGSGKPSPKVLDKYPPPVFSGKRTALVIAPL